MRSQLEARARMGQRAASAVTLAATAAGAAPVRLALATPAVRDPALGASDAAAAVTDALPLTEEVDYLVEVRARAGEALVRLQARVGDEPGEAAALVAAPAPVREGAAGDPLSAPPLGET